MHDSVECQIADPLIEQLGRASPISAVGLRASWKKSQGKVGRPPKNWLCRNTIRTWLRGELGQGYRECVQPPHRQVPCGASVDRGGTAPPCAASGGGYRWAASLP